MSSTGPRCSLGLDFGTNSVRALLVDVRTGRELATQVATYLSGKAGIILDSKNPNLARQNPADYLKGIEIVVRKTLGGAKKANKNFNPSRIIGIGIDTTGSTPIPVDGEGMPLCFKKEFRGNPNAMAWLWKDHT